MTRSTWSAHEEEITKIDSTNQKMLDIENVEMYKNVQDNTASEIDKHGNIEVAEVQCSITTDNSSQPTSTVSNTQSICTKTVLNDRHSTVVILQVQRGE